MSPAERRKKMWPKSTRKLEKRLRALVERVEYREDYGYIVGLTEGMRYPYVQIWHHRPCAITGKMGTGKGGKAYISEFATDSEIFQTLFGLAKAYEEHEVREFFKVDGEQVFGPHIKTTALASIARDTDYRTEEKPKKNIVPRGPAKAASEKQNAYVSGLLVSRRVPPSLTNRVENLLDAGLTDGDCREVIPLLQECPRRSFRSWDDDYGNWEDWCDHPDAVFGDPGAHGSH